jgi:hypothetical protein
MKDQNIKHKRYFYFGLKIYFVYFSISNFEKRGKKSDENSEKRENNS